MSKYSDNMPPSLKGAIEWMYDFINPNSKLLDFGCSTGYFGEYIKKHKDCTVYGIEISKDIEQARKVLDGVYNFDLDGEWPKEIYEGKYNYLFFGDVLEHLKDPGLVLKKCKKLLETEGKIFISTPNIAHISTRLELLSGNFEYEPMGILDETHLKYFTRNSLGKMIDDAGYKIDFVDYTANDYPKEVIEKLLKKLDIIAGPRFWKMTKTIEARAFQYKLLISINKNGALSKSEIKQSIKKPEHFRDDLISNLNNQIKSLKKHADKQTEIIEHYVRENKKSELEIAKLNHMLEARLRKRTKQIIKKVRK